jgi:hypothetical protein
MPQYMVEFTQQPYEFTVEAASIEEARAAAQADLDNGKFPDNYMGVSGEWELESVVEVTAPQAKADMTVHDGKLTCWEDLPIALPDGLSEDDQEKYTGTIKALRCRSADDIRDIRARHENSAPVLWCIDYVLDERGEKP